MKIIVIRGDSIVPHAIASWMYGTYPTD